MSSTTGKAETSAPPVAGYVLGATGALLFASKSIIIKLAYDVGVDPETLLALRMVFSLPFYLVIGAIALVRMRKKGEALPSAGLVLRCALIGALGYWFASYTDFLGLQYISASFERLILFTYPLFVVLIGAALFGYPLRARALLAFAVSYCGLALFFVESFQTGGTDTLKGAGFVVLSALSFALYQLLASQQLRSVGSALFTCIAMTSASLVSLAQFALVRPVSALMVSYEVLTLALMMAIGATVLPTFLMNAALKRITPAANAMISTASPVATMALAFLFLGESATMIEVAGAALVLAGIGWFTIADARSRAR